MYTHPGILSSFVSQTTVTLEDTGRFPFAEKHASVAFTLRGPRVSEHSRQSQTSHREDKISLVIYLYSGEVAENYPTPMFLPTALKKCGVKRRWHDLSSVFTTVDYPDIPWHPQFFRGRRTALFRQRDACTLVLSVEAREGPNTQDRAGRLIAVPGHLFKHMMATYHPPCIPEEVGCTSSITQWAFRKLRMKLGVELHQRDLSSGFLTVGDADTPLQPQFGIDGGLVSAATGSLTRCRGNLGSFFFSIFPHCCVCRFRGIFRFEGCPPGGDICNT